MPTNANTFNSRVTSEELEAKFRQVFPAQGGAELVQDLFASGVIQPVVDFTTVAEGSVLPPNLQTAWDFSTGVSTIRTATPQTVINNTGFWQVDFVYAGFASLNVGIQLPAVIDIWDGSTSKPIWALRNVQNASASENTVVLEDKFVVFLKAGESLRGHSQNTETALDIWYRQIADVNGNLVNPLGFTFS